MLNVDPSFYTYVEKGDIGGIKILKPIKWKDTIFTYQIGFLDENYKQMGFQIDYKVLVTAPGLKFEDYEIPEFGELVENIVKSIMIEIGDLIW